MNCVIIDDEPLAREGIANYVREIDFLRLVGTCENPMELIGMLDERQVDLIFLDIQMPKMNGLDFLKIVKNPPLVVITTAFPSFAIESFQLNVLDYLLKPITFDRFFKAAHKAKDYHTLMSKATPVAGNAVEKPDYFFIKCGSKYEKIMLADILFIEGMQNYVTIYTTRGKYVTLLYMKNLEQNLDNKSFIRVHKSYIVAIGKVEGIEGNEIFIENHRIPVSRSLREHLLNQIVHKNLWIK